MKKIDFSTFKQMTEDSLNTTTVIWNGMEIAIRPTLPIADVLEFVNKITLSCFDSETGEYTPEFRDAFVKRGIIDYYTNIELPSDINEWYELVSGSGIIEMVIDHINPVQFDEILSSANSEIEYEKSINVQDVTTKIKNTLNAMHEMTSKFDELLDGITKDDLENFTSAIAAERYKDVDFVKEISHSLSKRDVAGEKVVQINGNDH